MASGAGSSAIPQVSAADRDAIAAADWQVRQINARIAETDARIAAFSQVLAAGGRSATSAHLQIKQLRSQRLEQVANLTLAQATHENAISVGLYGGERIDFSRVDSESTSVSWAALRGAGTGLKAVTNAAATQTVSFLTLGSVDYAGPLAVTQWDIESGYGSANFIANGSIGLGTALLGGPLSKLGKGIGVAYTTFDAAGNVVSLARGTESIYSDGLNWSNGAQTVGGSLGVFGNSAGTRSILAGTSNVVPGRGFTTLDPSTIRFSQTTPKQQGATVEALTESMRRNGFIAEPEPGIFFDIVRMPDGRLTTLDNTRLLAARRAGVDVEARVFNYDEPLPNDPVYVSRFIGRKGEIPSTFGDAVKNRIGTQSSMYRTRYPSGSQVIGSKH